MRDFTDRRTVLRSGVAACTAGLAGCLEGLTGGNDDSPPAENGTGDDDSGTDDDTEPEPEPEPVQSWPSFQNDARNSGYAEGRAPSEDLEVAWTFEGREDVGTNEDERMRGGPVISEDGIVYIGADDRAFYAIDIEDGSLVWSRELPRRAWLTPLVYEDIVIVSIADGVQAFDRHNGDLAWEFPVNEGQLPTTPAVDEETLVVGTGEKRIYGIDPAEGTELWSTDRERKLSEPPAIADGDAFVTDWTNEIHVLDLASGVERYTTTIHRETQLTGVTVAGGQLYVGGNEGTLFAKDLDNLGETIWTYDAEADSVSASPAAVGDQVIVCDSDVGVRSLSATVGSRNWTFENEVFSYSDPAVAGDTVFVGASSGKLYSIDRRTGELVDDIELAEFVVYSPAIARGKIVAGTYDGSLYGIHSSDV